VTVLRHSVHFLYRESTTPEQRGRLERGLAFLGMECPTVSAGDYGGDLFGGSGPLLEVPPWKRTPRWRPRPEGPPSNFDVALHLDFEDEGAMATYVADDRHREIAEFNASVTVDEQTARVDWHYDGPPLSRRGLIRHSAMFVWSPDAGAPARARALQAVRALGDAPGVISLEVGENAGASAMNLDWILDVQLADAATAEGFITGPAYTEAIGVVASATKHEWTSWLTHMMRGPGR
jgi:hypothetical protein